MTTPQQFVESFLQEKAKAWGEARPYLKPVFSNYFDNALLQNAEQFMPRDTVPVVEHVTQTHGVASVITHERFKKWDFRTRYRLAVEGESWKIAAIDSMCVRCRGTGQFHDSKCQRCDGEGFRTSNTDD